jgi:hypothetical protein
MGHNGMKRERKWLGLPLPATWESPDTTTLGLRIFPPSPLWVVDGEGYFFCSSYLVAAPGLLSLFSP